MLALLCTPLVEKPEIVVHAPRLARYIGHWVVAFPGVRAMSSQQPAWKDGSELCDGFQQPVPPETFIVAAEAMILEQHCEG